MSLACKTHWATKDFQSQSASEIWSGQFLSSTAHRYDSLGYYYARDALKSDNNNNGSNETANL